MDEAASMLHQFEEVQQCPIDEVGTPVLELFLKKDAKGELQQQGTVLSIPPEMLSQAQAKMGECHSPFQFRNIYVNSGMSSLYCLCQFRNVIPTLEVLPQNTWGQLKHVSTLGRCFSCMPDRTDRTCLAHL